MGGDRWYRIFRVADAVATGSMLAGCAIFALPASGILDFVDDRDLILTTIHCALGMQIAAILVAIGSLFIFHLRQASRR
jgi:hypothetical protein